MASGRELHRSDDGDNDTLEERILDDLTQSEANMDLEEGRLSKRRREENNEETWITVVRNSKKKTNEREESSSSFVPIQICVTSKEKLPKQFALAKLLQQNEIGEINKVKYVNPYKLLITFGSTSSADNFLCCSAFDSLNWRRQKTWEVGLSYGIIRDIDQGLSEEELIKYLQSEKEILSLKRLNRKTEEGWTTSETIRVGFKGSSLPSYIRLYEVKIKVEPYVFPVTQCAKCWRYGHPQKLCPSSKTVCPKCGNNHANCEVKVYKCVNCSGGHMALSKNCPLFKKEKRLRELMAEFNCTYQKALTIYVPPSPRPIDSQTVHESYSCLPNETVYEPSYTTPSYANIARRNHHSDTEESIAQKNDSQNTAEKKRKKKKKKKSTSYHISENVVAELDVTYSDNSSENQKKTDSGKANQTPRDHHQNKPSTFKELLQKLRRVIADKDNGLVATLKTWIKIIVDYINNFIKKLIGT